MAPRKKPEKKPPFKVGDLVVIPTGSHPKTIRKVYRVVPSSDSGSGFLVSADGGARCEACGNQAEAAQGSRGQGIDSSWFKKW